MEIKYHFPVSGRSPERWPRGLERNRVKGEKCEKKRKKREERNYLVGSTTVWSTIVRSTIGIDVDER